MTVYKDSRQPVDRYEIDMAQHTFQERRKLLSALSSLSLTPPSIAYSNDILLEVTLHIHGTPGISSSSEYRRLIGIIFDLSSLYGREAILKA